MILLFLITLEFEFITRNSFVVAALFRVSLLSAVIRDTVPHSKYLTT